jgi:hypothetical protein
MTLRLSKALAALALSAGFTLTAYPWGTEGHRAVGLVATQNLSESARAHVVKILGSDDLSSIAVWMDELRSAQFHSGPLAADPEALRFNAEFPRNGEWHYVDLPLGTMTYELDGAFSNPHDVVHMIEEAVRVLEGGGDKRITPLEALRMIVHFVGDLHQPLHVGNGFFVLGADGSVKLVEDPAAATGLPNDKGGNADFFGPGRYDELHAYWDTELVVKITGSKEPADIAAVLAKKLSADGAGWKSPGDYHHWPEGWAGESLAAARTAFSGITFGAYTPDPKGGIKRISITLPPHYDDTCIPLATERLAKAGYHLAELLNMIHWAD